MEQGYGLACYQSLLSYANQYEQEQLNRYLVRDILRDWMDAQVTECSTAMTREEPQDQMKKLVQSSRESDLLNWLYEHGHLLPEEAQLLIKKPYGRPDFRYDTGRVCVYIDGRRHQSHAGNQQDARDRTKPGR